MNLAFQPAPDPNACQHDLTEALYVSTPNNHNYPTGTPYSDEYCPMSDRRGSPNAYYWEPTKSRCCDCWQPCT